MADKNPPDLSEFYKLSKPRRKPCAIGHVKTLLPKREAEQLDAALALDKGIITGAAIREWLKARDHILNDAVISSHRRGVCSCHD